MEIRRMLRGEDTGFVPARPVQRNKESKPAGRARVDRLELSQEWVRSMEEQRVQSEAALLSGGKQEKKSEGILGVLDGPDAEEQELDALSKDLDVKMKCLKIAMNIMKGKKVPLEDERYLMENDPEGYKLAIAMKAMTKEDKKECKSVLDDEDKNGKSSETSGESGEAVSAETASGSGGETAE